jgi:Ca2+-transporting ATPase
MIRSYGLTAELLAVAQVWEIGGRGTVVAAKGAPEAIAALCGLTGETLAKLHASVDAMAARGLRVLGLATAQHEGAQCPASPRGFKFTYQGLVGLLDPVRASVPGAIAQCRSAGIRVVMITGDHPQTARAIAEAAGLDASKVRTGAELMAMDDAQLAAAVLSASVFARILPEQKLRIVEALQRHGEVVAMTGDGVNDAPSLKAADIGIAMGQRGTDVAREASAIVLLDDDFDSIVNAVRIGRRIYDNLRKSIEFILAVHVPIAGLGLLPLITGLPILFWPVHIAFLEMIVDPVCSLVFEAEPEEPGIMRRPPRRPDEHLFPVRVIVASAAQGLVALLVAASVYVLILAGGASDDVARAMTMVALVGSILGLIVTNRTFGASLIAALARPTRVLAVVTALVGAVLLSALALPPVRDLFGFAPLNWTQVAIALGASLLALVLLELAKLASLHLAASRTATADPLRKGGS